MRTLITTVAFAMFVTTAASAGVQSQKPGEYAKSSAVYAEILRACQRSFDRHFSSDNIRALKLEDEAARHAEKLYKDNPAQFKLQIKGCQMSLPKQAAAKPKQGFQPVASNIPPAALVGAGAVVGAVLARNVRQPHRGRDEDNYAEVRAYLKNYKGPLWHTKGQIRNRYMNKQAPESAVPCKPPGYDHVVLCNPR